MKLNANFISLIRSIMKFDGTTNDIGISFLFFEEKIRSGPHLFN